MSNPNYMLADWLGILIGFGLFPLFAVTPGYAVGWTLDILGFRQRSLPFRLAFSVPLSIALGPIVSHLVGRALSLAAVEAMYGVLFLFVLFLAYRGLREGSRTLPRLAISLWKVLGVVCIWLIIALLMLADIQIRDRLYYPVMALDYTVRTAFVSVIGAFGLPAHSPFYFPMHPVGLHYHYLWLIQCALLERLAGAWVDPRQALIAGTLWCGIGMLCLIPLYLKLFSPLGGTKLYRRTLFGLCLMGITGLDVLPSLFKLRMHFAGVIKGVSPSVEWWNDQVDGWLYTMLWEPHYICSLVAGLTAFLILWQARDQGSRKRRMISAGVAGMALGTAAGAGIYVAFVFAVFLVLWTAIAFVNGRRSGIGARETPMLAVAGMAALCAALPFLLELNAGGGPLGGGASGAATEFPIRFTVRSIDLIPLDLIFRSQWKAAVGNLALLPLNYFLELGFFYAVGRLVWKAFRAQERMPSPQEWAAFAMAGSSVAICTFLKSSIIENNDLGWRGFLPAQFVLLLWAADVFGGPETAQAGGPFGESPSKERLITPPLRLWNRPGMVLLVLLGAAGTVYDLAILRFYPLWSDQGKLPPIYWMSGDERLGKRNYAAREAYRWLKAHTPPRSIVLQNPDPRNQETSYGLYADRQTVAEDPTCGGVFSADTSECAATLTRLTPLYANGASLEKFHDACAQLPMDVAVVKDTDGAWSDRSSWVWAREPKFKNDYFRLFQCDR